MKKIITFIGNFILHTIGIFIGIIISVLYFGTEFC